LGQRFRDQSTEALGQAFWGGLHAAPRRTLYVGSDISIGIQRTTRSATKAYPGDRQQLGSSKFDFRKGKNNGKTSF
jgi:hypothetical protein